MEHAWAMSWPGNFCTHCGAEDAMENAIGEGWYDPMSETWGAPEQKELVELCQQHCFAKLTPEQQKPIIERMKALEEKINAERPERNPQK